MFVNSMPRYEILSEDAMQVIDRGWRRLVSEIGIEFLLPEAVDLLVKAGQTLEDENRIRFDPEFVLEQVAKAPREFELQARNPANTAHIGGDHMVFAPVYGCPFIREGDVRRDAKMADFENLVKLSQAFEQLDSPGGHFLGAAHTLERFRECFYRPLVSSTENFERWNRNGAHDTADRASEIWKKTLEEYEQPPIDEGLEEELKAFVDRRRTELGD